MSPLALSIRFLHTQPDKKLIELAQAGHERAFEALIQRYRRPLLRYCRRLSMSDAAAEDALQQALLQAWVALGASEVPIKEARAWLYRIVHNVAISNLRRPVHDTVDVEPAHGTSGADQEVERRLEVRDALAGLASLPEMQRQVMLSTALEGRSHGEIADALGLSHGAVRGLIYRARATLRAAAAALTPSPLLHWAARQEFAAGGRSAGIYEAIVVGGSAGLGGVLFKGGALVISTGALATAAGIGAQDLGQSSHHHLRSSRSAAVAGKSRSGTSLRQGSLEVVSLVRDSVGSGRSARAGARAGARVSGSSGTSSATRGGPGAFAGSGERHGRHGRSGHAFGSAPGGGDSGSGTGRSSSGSGSASGSGSGSGSGHGDGSSGKLGGGSSGKLDGGSSGKLDGGSSGKRDSGGSGASDAPAGSGSSGSHHDASSSGAGGGGVTTTTSRHDGSDGGH